MAQTAKAGDTVSVHYTGTLDAAKAHAAKQGHKKFEIKNLRSDDAKVGKFRVDVL